MPLLAIIRIRGTVDTPKDVEDTLKMLRLTRKFTCVLYPSTLPGISGMLKKVQGWVTWGEIDKDTLVELLAKRGRTPGNRRLTSSYLKDKLNIDSIESFADKLISGDLMLHKIDNVIKPVFRLHPPKGGFKGTIKRMYGYKGELGYRGKEINDLLRKMI